MVVRVITGENIPQSSVCSLLYAGDRLSPIEGHWKERRLPAPEVPISLCTAPVTVGLIHTTVHCCDWSHLTLISRCLPGREMSPGSVIHPPGGRGASSRHIQSSALFIFFAMAEFTPVLAVSEKKWNMLLFSLHWTVLKRTGKRMALLRASSHHKKTHYRYCPPFFCFYGPGNALV